MAYLLLCTTVQGIGFDVSVLDYGMGYAVMRGVCGYVVMRVRCVRCCETEWHKRLKRVP